MTAQPRTLTFCWWNLHNFAHYDAASSSKKRRWRSQADYDAQKRRFHDTFKQIFPGDSPDLLAFCEVTREAAKELAVELPGGFDLTVAAEYPHDDGFQVAVFYKRGMGFSNETPLFPSDRAKVAKGTRPMIPVHLTLPGHEIRFVACHWTAFEGEDSDLARERSADALREDTYEFLFPDVPKQGVARHIVVLGDLNEEPTAAIFRKQLPARRDRESTHDRHWRDVDVMRVRFYNLTWRFLGEQVAHGASGQRVGGAGTVFAEPHNWKTFDHVLVSCGLLTPNPPLIDEGNTGVVCTPLMLGDDRRPQPFVPNSTCGMSDHLPIVGRLILPENPK
jgi:endonuclease/exonuclease/phosphatase family metal-dependent hydrolase